MITDAMQDYLYTILKLEGEREEVRSIDIANVLKFSRASVHNMLQQLEAEGLIRITPRKKICLTDSGRDVARSYNDRILFLSKMLMDAGVAPEEAQTEAKGMGRCLSETSFHALRQSHENSGSQDSSGSDS